MHETEIAMPKTILVIDNDQDILDAVSAALSTQEFNVCTYAVVENIFDTIQEAKPDLVLIDYLLYGINGGELCHLIKSSPDTAHLPVIIFSGYPRVMQSLGTYACDEFISKPFDLDDFLRKINKHLQLSEGNS